MSEQTGIFSQLEVEAARDLVRELVRTVRGFRLYEGNHPTLTGMQQSLRKHWEMATAGGPIVLRLTEQEVLVEDEPVLRATGAHDVVPNALYDHGVVGLVLKRGIDPEEVWRFARVLATEPNESFDYGSLLWEADLKHVQVLLDADERDDDEACAPEDFARVVVELGSADDALIASEFEAERRELEETAGQEAPELDRELTAPEQERLQRELDTDDFVATLRHACRVIHAMAHDAADSGATGDAVDAVVRALASSGSLAGVAEMLGRARTMAGSEDPPAARVGQRTLDVFEDPENLGHFLRALDRFKMVQARDLAECLAHLGPASSEVLARWLLETRHPAAAAQAMRVCGDVAVEALVAIYLQGSHEDRTRVTPALIEIGTPRALAALASQFRSLPESSRLKLVRLGELSTEPALRGAVLAGLRDPEASVRLVAHGAVRRADAPAVAAITRELLDQGAFDRRPREEVEDFFEMLARIGDTRIAELLAAHCLPKGLLGFRRLDELQRLCVRALRRMRSPDARAVADELRAHGPRAVRDLLDDPLADLDA